MAKKILLGVEARAKFLEGANFLGDAIQSTLGPHGQNFWLQKGRHSTNDGKKIAAELEHEDEIAHEGLVACREAGIKTEAEVFDASSTAMVLCRAIAKETSKQLPASGTVVKGRMTPSQVLKKIAEEREIVSQIIKDMAVEITSKEELVNATIVSTDDKDLGKLIGEAQWTLGKEGVLIAEETTADASYVEFVPGILIDNGFSSSLVINNHEKMSLEAEKASVILTNHVINSTADIMGILNPLAKSGVKTVVVVARAFTEQAIKDCMDNVKGGFNVFPVNAPYVNQNEVMKDLQALLGGRYIRDEETSLDQIELSDVGYAEKISCERYRATFEGTKNDEAKARIAARVEELKQEFDGSKSVFEKKGIERRLGQLSAGFGIVHIGSYSETERKRLKDKADDAVGTVRMALKSGVVPGAGQAYKTASDALPAGSLLKEPLKVIYNQIMSSSPEGFVIEDWVKDPAITLITALKFASEIGANIGTIGGVSATKKEKPRLVEEVDRG